MPRRQHTSYFPYHQDMASCMGDIPGVVYSDKFGYNSAVGTAFEDVWDVGGTYSGWLTTASTVRVQAGGNAADTAAGAGARTIRVVGLDENWDPAQEDITLAGASESAATTTTFIRVNRAYVLTTGTYATQNTGNIIVEDTNTTTALAVIGAGLGQTEMFMLSVPRNQQGCLNNLHIYVEANKDIELQLWVRDNANLTTAPFGSERMLRRMAGVTGFIDMTGQGLPTFGAYSDIWMRAKASSGTASVSVIGTGWFVDV